MFGSQFTAVSLRHGNRSKFGLESVRLFTSNLVRHQPINALVHGTQAADIEDGYM